MGLSCTAGHQDCHQHAHFHTEQDLPAPALGHHSKFKRKLQLSRREGKHKYSPVGGFLPASLSQPSDAASHAVKTDLQCMKCSCLDQHPISSAADCVLAEEEWRWWDWVLSSLSLTTLNHFSAQCHEVTQLNKTHVLVYDLLCFYHLFVTQCSSHICSYILVCFFFHFSCKFAHFYNLSISAT